MTPKEAFAQIVKAVYSGRRYMLSDLTEKQFLCLQAHLRAKTGFRKYLLEKQCIEDDKAEWQIIQAEKDKNETDFENAKNSFLKCDMTDEEKEKYLTYYEDELSETMETINYAIEHG